MRAAVHPDGDDRLVIESFHAGRVLGGGLEERIHYAVRRLARALGNDLLDPAASEEFAFAVARIENAVAEEHEHVTSLHAELEFVVVRFVKQAERKPVASTTSFFPPCT